MSPFYVWGDDNWNTKSAGINESSSCCYKAINLKLEYSKSNANILYKHLIAIDEISMFNWRSIIKHCVRFRFLYDNIRLGILGYNHRGIKYYITSMDTIMIFPTNCIQQIRDFVLRLGDWYLKMTGTQCINVSIGTKITYVILSAGWHVELVRDNVTCVIIVCSYSDLTH